MLCIPRRPFVLLAVAAGVCGASLAASGCGARTGLPVPAPVPCAGATGAAMSFTCASGETSITGTVYDPAGKHPLYNVVVYVPTSTPQPITSGPTCGSCDDLYTGDPIATALTDANGNFTLSGVPDGANVPLVLQVGKWRRQLTVPSVEACQDNPQPDKSLRMPASQAEGDIPSIAVSTGTADTLECLFLRVGIDASEYGGGPDGPGRIHVFQGPPGVGQNAGQMSPNTSPPAPQSYAALWDSDADILRYDMVFLSCEGSETQNMNQEVLFDYAAAGGRVFASHFHYAWFDTGPFGQENLATWLRGTNNLNDISADIVTTLPNGQPFPQGVALDHWLATTGALVNGELPIQAARHNANVSAANTASQPWIVASQDTLLAPGATQYFTFSTPFGAAPADQCGQVVYTDMHIGAGSGDDPDRPVPAECNPGDLSPQETALEFVLFNLSSCLTPPGQTPVPPPTCVRARE